MKPTSLPIAPGCGECSRRAMLQGLGVAAVGALIYAGCQQQGSSLSTANSTTCGTSHCIDLGDAANQALTTTGGAVLVDIANDTVMVIRNSDTQVIALSAICTHAGCSMDYNASQHMLDCPCHGSQFSTDGAVVQGPARRALKVYTATLANNVITIT